MSHSFSFLNISPKLVGINYQQKQLLNKLEHYLNARSKKNPAYITTNGHKLPYESHTGLCAGLVAYWLYCKRLNKDSEFIANLEYILNWDSKSFIKSTAKDDPLIEDFLNAIELLNFHSKIMPDVTQRDLRASFALLTDKKENQIAEPEFKITFAFNKIMLEQLFLNVVRNNKMIRLGNGEHAVGLMRNGDTYSYYNPENKHGPQTFTATAEIVTAVFRDFKQFSHSHDYLALNLIAYDLELTRNEDSKYPSAIQYCVDLLQNPENKKPVFNNKDILELALICKDYKIIELLINNDCVTFKDVHNRSALSMAIMYESPVIVYALLMSGADLSSASIPALGSNLWQLTLLNENTEVMKMIMIMLLAFGLELTHDDIINAQHKFPQSFKKIAEHAVALNLKLLNLPDSLNLDRATGEEIIAFLRNAKLRVQCGIKLKDVTIQNQGKTVAGLTALELIVQHYHTNTSDAIEVLPQQTEIYKLLKFFKNENLKFKGSDDLLAIIKKIGKKIVSQDIRKYTASDHAEIDKIIAELYDLSKENISLGVNNLIFKYEVAQVLNDIKKHLKKWHESKPTRYHPGHLFFPVNTKIIAAEQPEFAKIAPMLNL